MNNNNHDKTQYEKLQKSNVMTFLKSLFPQAFGIPVGWRSDGRLATTLVATVNDILFRVQISTRTCEPGLEAKVGRFEQNLLS